MVPKRTGNKAGTDTGLAVDQTSLANLVQEFRSALGIELFLEVKPDPAARRTPPPADRVETAENTVRSTPRPRRAGRRRFVGAPTVETGPPPGMPKPPPRRGRDETLRTGPPARMSRSAAAAAVAGQEPPRMLPLPAGLPGAPQDWIPTVAGRRPRPSVEEPTTERYIPLPRTRKHALRVSVAALPLAESSGLSAWQVTATGLSLALLVLCILFLSSC